MSFVQPCVKLLSGVRNVTFLTFSWMWIGKLVFTPLQTVMKVCEDRKPLTQDRCIIIQSCVSCSLLQC